MDVNKAVTDYFAAQPNATSQQAIEHAKETFGDTDERVAFIREWSRRKNRQTKFKDDVDRNWPERKGY